MKRGLLPRDASGSGGAAASCQRPSRRRSRHALLDAFEDIAPWQAVASDGVTATLRQVNGADGRALCLDYDFHGVSGYAVARRDAADDVSGELRVLAAAARRAGRRTTSSSSWSMPAATTSGGSRSATSVLPSQWTTMQAQAAPDRLRLGPDQPTRLLHSLADLRVDGQRRQGRQRRGVLRRAHLPRLASRRPGATAPARHGQRDAARTSRVRCHRRRCDHCMAGDQARYAGAGGRPRPRARIRRADPAVAAGPARLALPHRPVRRRQRMARGAPRRRGRRRRRPDRAARIGSALPALAARRRAGRRLRVGGAAHRGPRVRAQRRTRSSRPWLRRTPRGWYPRGFVGEQPYWTIVGIDGGHAAGIARRGRRDRARRGVASSVEPFVVARRPAGELGRRAGIAGAAGRLPADSVGALAASRLRARRHRVRAGHDRVVATGCALPPAQYRRDGRATTPSRSRCGRSRSTRRASSSTRPAASARSTRSVSSATSRSSAANRGCVALSAPDAVFATAFDAGDVVAHLSADTLPPERNVSDPTGLASGAWVYRVHLAPGEAREVAWIAPLTGDAADWSGRRRRRHNVPLRRPGAKTFDRVRIRVPDDGRSAWSTRCAPRSRTC